jgi:hypothetical protein
VTSEGGLFGVIKVLAVADGVVHVRLYREKFPERPSRIVATSLTLGSLSDSGGFGMGHLPLSGATFASWVSVPFQNEPVTEAELEGYRMWQENAGGVW